MPTTRQRAELPYPVSIFNVETGAFPVSYVPLAERQASKGLSVAHLRAFHERSGAWPFGRDFPYFWWPIWPFRPSGNPGPLFMRVFGSGFGHVFWPL